MQSGYQLACAMWALTALSLTLVGLRLYTRIRVVKFVGAEDHMYAWTGLFLLLFTIFIQVAVHYGLGRSFYELSIDDSSDAIFWTYVANSFAIIGNAMAKLSMGLFLLRVVQARWHKIALWGAVVVTSATSIALTIMLWNQSTPVKASWDPLRTPGTWDIQIQPMSVGLGVWSSICDFFFAIFPWLFLRSLHMPRREKVMLASGMSLGVIAGACGITRTVVLSTLNVYNYTLNFVPYFAWAGAEIAVAMVCIGVPTLRPLYLKARGLSSTLGSIRQSNASELPQFTMCDGKEVLCPPPARDSGFSQFRPNSRIAKPPPAYTRARSDSVDDIISEYDGSNGDVIWVKNEVRVENGVAEWPLRG
ncbi:Uu.00g120590.m01.CDS01 [Anthostomella pinea]|uniref:Uu.00g120590.m01.CDS01 n=1 Tax=Anthostomella pinea TaxID=933095 RepID=A0AAI8YH51_9PEZI|nr:Uu.00g120590.m01.CDS01 [Anthostomella pinea]